ncbi:11713_t:CDS:1, partial [Acaulospora morrowiae]
MAFASVVSNIQSPSGRGPFVYKISGQMYHFLGSAQPNEGDIPSFGQLYFLDTADAQEYRNNNPVNAKLDPALFLLLDSILRQVSPFSQAFEMMREMEQEKHGAAIQQGRQPMEVQMVFDNDRRLDQRHYNASRVNEVAAIFVGSSDNIFPSHSLAIHPRGGQLKTIPIIN